MEPSEGLLIKSTVEKAVVEWGGEGVGAFQEKRELLRSCASGPRVGPALSFTPPAELELRSLARSAEA